LKYFPSNLKATMETWPFFIPQFQWNRRKFPSPDFVKNKGAGGYVLKGMVPASELPSHLQSHGHQAAPRHRTHHRR
jgi:hypothetical protein